MKGLVLMGALAFGFLGCVYEQDGSAMSQLPPTTSTVAPTPLVPAAAPSPPAQAQQIAPLPAAIDNTYHPSWTVDVW